MPFIHHAIIIQLLLIIRANETIRDQIYMALWIFEAISQFLRNKKKLGKLMTY